MTLLDSIQRNGSVEYRSYAATNPAWQSVGELVLLYGQDDIEERNETFEVQKYLAGWFAVGDDGDVLDIAVRGKRIAKTIFTCVEAHVSYVDLQGSLSRLVRPRPGSRLTRTNRWIPGARTGARRRQPPWRSHRRMPEGSRRSCRWLQSLRGRQEATGRRRSQRHEHGQRVPARPRYR